MLQEKDPGVLLLSEQAKQAAYLENRTLLDAAVILARHRNFILGFTAVAFVLALIISLFLPNYFTATTRIMPPKQTQSLGYSAMMGEMGPLMSAAGVGAESALHNPSDLYVAMLKSRTIADALLDKFSLEELYRKTKREEARRWLGTLTEIIAGKDGVISISVDDRDPARAAAIANGYVAELDKLTGSLAITEASQRRLFFEKEVENASNDLTQAEDALRETEERTGVFQLDSQSKAMIEYASNLRAQITAKQAQLKAMESFATANNPDLLRAQEELTALRTELARSERGQIEGRGNSPAIASVPAAGLEYKRGLREVKYRESLLDLLTKQYELARVDEAKDVPIIQVMDKAIPPELKSRPHRLFLVASVALLSFFLAVIITFLRESFSNAREHPEFASRLDMLKIYLRLRRMS